MKLINLFHFYPQYREHDFQVIIFHYAYMTFINNNQ